MSYVFIIINYDLFYIRFANTDVEIHLPSCTVLEFTGFRFQINRKEPFRRCKPRPDSEVELHHARFFFGTAVARLLAW